MILQRYGYGNCFNEIKIDNNVLTKRAKNAYGINRLKNEIEFYKFIRTHNIKFDTPVIYELNNDNIIMEYIKECIPMYKVYDKSMMNVIHKKLDSLHSSSFVIISREQFFKDLKTEFYDKIVSRFDTIKNILCEYSYIKTVNGVNILPFLAVLQNNYSFIRNYYECLVDTEFIYNPIHGDCQFSNILVKGDDKTDIIFIDPRGYYGDSVVYGIKQYDYAKIKFALTGYDIFDSSNYINLDITGENINIDIKFFDISVDNPLIFAMCITIWLGNAHCFVDNKNKMLTSYFYALWLSNLNISFLI
jgi:hypothetical protein